MLGIEPEFIHMSSGLGKEGMLKYLDDFKRFGVIYIKTANGSRTMSMPRYLEKYYTDEELKEVKEKKRELAKANQKSKLYSTDLDIQQLREVEDRSMKAKLKIFQRGDL